MEGKTPRQAFWLENTLCKGGDLFDAVLAAEGLPENQGRKYFQQLVRAVSGMHQNGVVHRDIKLENVFIDGENVRIADFGMSEIFAGENRRKLSDKLGTLGYMAPELFRRRG